MNQINLWAYFRERFPPVNMALFAILFLTVYAVADFYTAGTVQEAGGYYWQHTWGVLATISFFFRLRVFDEIKDYGLDLQNHPQRVLQSGRVSLRQLMGLSVLGTLFEIAWSVYMGTPTLLCWVLAAGYSLLMRYEFFVGDFLRKRLLLYAITHMLVMPLIILWIWSAYVPGYGLGLEYFMLAVLSLLGGFSFELARKIHTSEAERPLVDSYSKSLGFSASIVGVLLVLLGGVAVLSYLLHLLQAGSWAYMLIAFLYLATLALYIISLRKPEEKKLRAAEKLVSLFMLISYLSIIIEVHF